MNRHFTATGFVVHAGKVVLLWHRLLQMWVPPGGHLEADEDPTTAVLREVREETGLRAEVIRRGKRLPFDYPAQIESPHTILLEDSPEPGRPHQHIDLIYFCRSLHGDALRPSGDDEVLLWVTEAQLRRNEALPLASCGLDIPVPEDVRALALEAIETARAAEHERRTGSQI